MPPTDDGLSLEEKVKRYRNLELRINEHILNDKPIDASWLQLRDDLRREIAEATGGDAPAFSTYEDPRHPYVDGAELADY